MYLCMTRQALRLPAKGAEWGQQYFAGWDTVFGLQELPGKTILQGINDGMAHVRNTQDEGNSSIPALAACAGGFNSARPLQSLS